mgnify:CR=1 FL=1
MADNVLGTKITDLEEAQAAGLTDDTLLIVEPETPPTKRSKLSTFFTWVKGKLAAWILSSYDEVMAATEAGYLVDALAVKDGFTQLNTNIINQIKIQKVSTTLNKVSGVQSWGIDAPAISGYRMVGILGLTHNYCLEVNVGMEVLSLGSGVAGFAARYSGSGTYTVFIEVTFLYMRG